MRVNVGCGSYPIPGWVNVDAHVERDDVLRADFTTLRLSGVVQVEMSHVLEHLSWRRSAEVLRHVHSWMEPDGRIRVEVPDLVALLAMDPDDPRFEQWLWGCHKHAGEFHCAGFTERRLRSALTDAGWGRIEARRFASTHPARVGYPCLEAVACA